MVKRDVVEVLERIFYGAVIIGGLVIIGIFFAECLVSVSISETKNVTIQEKLGAHGSEGQYLIIDMNDNVYTVEDNYLLGSFDASNRYAKLKVDHTYQVKTFGIRLPLLSWYPNILEIQEVEV